MEDLIERLRKQADIEKNTRSSLEEETAARLLMEAADQLDCLRVEMKAELDGRVRLRNLFGAQPWETMMDLVERLEAEARSTQSSPGCLGSAGCLK